MSSDDLNSEREIVKQPVSQSGMDAESGYLDALEAMKVRIVSIRLRTSIAINTGLIEMYWHLGNEILIRQEQYGWGSRVVDRLSQDLRHWFPAMKGLSRRNLLYMRQFASVYSDFAIVQQLVAQLPWGHILLLMDRVEEPDKKKFYATKAVENGWSRALLDHQISSQLYERQGKAPHNFERTLPAPNSDLAKELFKDPYQFDFLGLTEAMDERTLERSLLDRIKEFLLELGTGFAYIGNQYHLEVAGNDYFLDLLFYHVKLHAYIVIELKVGAFKPEFAGKMNFYLSAVDDLVRSDADGPSIGLILCRSKNDVIVEYALRDSTKPMGVAEYTLRSELPRAIRDMLPDPKEIVRMMGQTEQMPGDAESSGTRSANPFSPKT